MGFNSAFKGLKLLKKPGNGRLNNLNDPVLNVLKSGNDLNNAYEFISYTTQRPGNIRYKVYSATVFSEERPLFILCTMTVCAEHPAPVLTLNPLNQVLLSITGLNIIQFISITKQFGY